MTEIQTPEEWVRWWRDELHRERELRRKADAEATDLRVQLIQAQIELERLRQEPPGLKPEPVFQFISINDPRYPNWPETVASADGSMWRHLPNLGPGLYVRQGKADG
jgi:hypothetical protein